MEVHAHSHTPRKKWTHYFWEFLMLFLAVTLGFFVENRREHYIEHLREKQYARSLYDDLLIDTMTQRRTIGEKKWAFKKMDSLVTIISSNQVRHYNEEIYFFERFLVRNDIFTPQDVTYRQLLSSGNFRYFKNLKLYKKISDYYNLYTRYMELAEKSFVNPVNLLEIEGRLFNGADLNSLTNLKANNFYTIFHRPAYKFRPVTNDTEALNQLVIIAGADMYAVRAAEWFIGELYKVALEIINELKKEYNIN